MASKGKLTTEQRELIKQHIAAGIPAVEVARLVTETTGKITTGQQVNGYKNVITGVAGSRPGQGTAGGFPQQTTVPLEGSKKNPGMSPEGFTQPMMPTGAGADGFSVQAAQVKYEYDIYRTTPQHGFLARVGAPFGPDTLAEQFRDGVYDIHKIANGRAVQTYIGQRVSGHGPPRFKNGMVAPGSSPYVHMEGPHGTPPYSPPYGYPPQHQQGYPYGPTPIQQDPSQQLRSIAEVADRMASKMTPPQDPAQSHMAAVNASLGFASQLINKHDSAGNGISEWFRTWAMQQAEDRKAERVTERERSKEDATAQEARWAHEREVMEDKAKIEREKIREDFDRQKALDKENHERQMERDREWSRQQKDLQESRDKILFEKMEDLKQLPEAMQAELDEKVALVKDHNGELLKIHMRGVDDQRRHNTQMYDLQMKNMESQKGDGLIAKTIQMSVDKISATADRALLIKTIKDMPPEERKQLVPILDRLSGGPGTSGNGDASGTANGSASAGDALKKTQEVNMDGDFGRGEVDKVLKSKFFRTLQEEWGLHVASKRGPFMFCRTFITYMNTSASMVLFANYMIVRSWDKMLETMGPNLDAKTKKIFETPEAKEFFDEFTTLLNDNIHLSMSYASKAIHGQVSQPGASVQAAAPQ